MKKLIIALSLLLTVCLIFSGCAEEKSGGSDMTAAILAHFEELAGIPRPSHHEKQVSDFLKNWAEGLNLAVVQDEANNLIIEVPATSGFEGLPKVALQCHMDMVFAQKEGLALDPLTTAVKTVNDGTYLSSDGNTSLGGDDGIGIATVMCIAEGKADHGPLRIIITTDEEDGMTGITNLDRKYVADIDCLINVDDEEEGEICISSACADVSDFAKSYESAVMTKEKAYQIELKGLSGGHSGLDIDKNRLNAAMETGAILNTLSDEGIDFELKSLTGGTAKNAIMSAATAVICIDADDFEKTEAVINTCRDKLKEKSASTDPGLELLLSEIAVEDDFVLPETEKSAVLSFLKDFKNGIRSMSPDLEGLVECSANLGIISVNPTDFYASVMSRSSDNGKEEEQLNEQKELAKALGFDISLDLTGKAWERKPDNKLEALACESYKRLFGTDIKVVAIHAGLECGVFAEYNENLNMISMGPTVLSTHSVDEKIEIASVEKIWLLLTDMLVNLG